MALVATSPAFDIVFGVFVVAFVGLSIYVAIWAFRRASVSRASWLEERSKGDGTPENPHTGL
jgi:hypothetical protein